MSIIYTYKHKSADLWIMKALFVFRLQLIRKLTQLRYLRIPAMKGTRSSKLEETNLLNFQPIVFLIYRFSNLKICRFEKRNVPIRPTDWKYILGQLTLSQLGECFPTPLLSVVFVNNLKTADIITSSLF